VSKQTQCLMLVAALLAGSILWGQRAAKGAGK